MKNLPTIYELGANQSAVRGNFKLRKAARAVVHNKQGQVALLHVTKNAYHKLPGGGIDAGEDVLTALKREMLEEIGCEITGIQKLGKITEYRDAWELTQVSYFYTAKQTGSQHAPSFTSEELADGFEIVWADNLDAAIAILQADRPQGYEGPLIQRRDVAILKAAQEFVV